MSSDVRQSRRLSAVLRWALTAAWMVVIFIGSAQPGSRVPGRFSLLLHLAEYAVLGALAMWAARSGRDEGRAAAAAVLLGATYALSDEIHQLFVPGRVADPLDWSADLIGTALGVVLLFWITRRRPA